jgi:hypothetical protein
MRTNIWASGRRSRILRGSLPAVVVSMFLVFFAPGADALAASSITVSSVTNPLLQGFRNVPVTITGTGFTTGAKVEVSGTGVTLTSPEVVSASTIKVKATVTATAKTGTRSVTVTTKSGSATCTGCVTIRLQGGSLYLSPTNQTVTSGSDVTVDVVVNTASYSINTVQSLFKYSPTNFSFVNAEPGPDFGEFPMSEKPGSIEFAAGTTGSVSGTQVAAVITLQATGTGSSSLKLARLCPPDDYAISCSEDYDATTSEQDLSRVVRSTTYTVT